MRAPEEHAAVNETGTDERYRVRSLERALDLLEALAQGGRAGASRDRAVPAWRHVEEQSFSILHTLIARGYVADEGEGMTRRYRLTRALAELADGALGTDSVTTAGQKILESLTAHTGLTSRLAVLDDGYVVALLRVDGPGPVQLSTYLGKRELPHCSGVGKAILASLPRRKSTRSSARIGLPRRTPQTITSAATLKRQLKIVRERGYSFDDEEDHEGRVLRRRRVLRPRRRAGWSDQRQRLEAGPHRSRPPSPRRHRPRARDRTVAATWLRSVG